MKNLILESINSMSDDELEYLLKIIDERDSLHELKTALELLLFDPFN